MYIENVMIHEQLVILNRIHRVGEMSKPLDDAICATIKALQDGDIELAYELSAVKSLICGCGVDATEHHFFEDTDKNRELLDGKSVYALLDGVHHELAYQAKKMPSGVSVISLGGIKNKEDSTIDHPVLERMRLEHKHIREGSTL